MDERTPEEQAVLDELKEERFTDNISSINWAEGYETAPGYNPANRTPKKVNKEKVRNLLRIFGADIFGPALDSFVDAVAAYFSGESAPSVEPFA